MAGPGYTETQLHQNGESQHSMAQTDPKLKVLPKGRPPGSRNKPKDNPKPRKPYTSTKRTRCVVKEDLLERLKREVTEQSLAVIPCDQFEAWLAAYATHEGNDYVRKDQHEHTYNSTHHRVVTYGCNHTETHPRIGLNGNNVTLQSESLDSTAQNGNKTTEEDQGEFETIGCDAILDIYYFYESNVYQIVQLGEHEHNPTNMPQILFGAIPGIGVGYRS